MHKEPALIALISGIAFGFLLFNVGTLAAKFLDWRDRDAPVQCFKPVDDINCLELDLKVQCPDGWLPGKCPPKYHPTPAIIDPVIDAGNSGLLFDQPIATGEGKGK